MTIFCSFPNPETRNQAVVEAKEEEWKETAEVYLSLSLALSALALLSLSLTRSLSLSLSLPLALSLSLALPLTLSLSVSPARALSFARWLAGHATEDGPCRDRQRHVSSLGFD